MDELVTIGGQSFIYDQKLGWIDRKTKAPADEKLLKLLNTVSPNRATPADKKQMAEDAVKEKKEDVKKVEEVAPIQPQENMTKLRTKVAKGVDPVNIGGQRFVYSNNGWVDEKTKQPAPKNLLKLFDTLVPSAKESMGAVGEIQSEKIKTKKGDNLRAPKINKLFVKMIDEIAQIDAYFAARVSMKRSEVNSLNLQNKENVIENVDKSAEITKAAVEDSSSGSTLAKLGGMAGLAALIAVAYDPLYNEIKKVYDHTKVVGSYITDFSKKINGFLEWFLDDSNATKFHVDHPQIMTDQELKKMRDDKLNSYTPASMPPLLAKPSLKTPSGDLKAKPVSNPWASAMTGGNKPNFVQNPQPKQNVAQSMPTKQAAAIATNSKMYDAMTTTKSTIMQPRGAEKANAQVKQQTKQLGDGPPKGDMLALRKWLQAQGFIPSEQDGVDGRIKDGHSKNSKHYTGDAIDVNIPGFHEKNHEANDPVAGARFDVLAKQLRDAGYGVLWRTANHYNHLHVQKSGPSTIGPGGVEGMAQEAIKLAQDSFEQFIKIVKKVGSTDTEFKPLGYDKYRNIDEAQNRKNKQMIDSKTKKEAPVMELPDLNMGKGTVHTPKRSSESSGVINQYISYFD